VIKSKLFFWSLLLLAFSIPLSQFFSVRLLFTICILSFFNSDIKSFSQKVLSNSWDIALYLTVLGIGLIYSEDIETGLRVIETSFSLLAFPLVFGRLVPFEKSEVHKIILSFIFGLVLSCTICLTIAAILYSYDRDIHQFFFYKLTEGVDLQPTYLAYYICFAITLLLYFLYYGIIRISHWVQVLSILFLFTVLMLTAGRTAYISMLLTLSFFMLKFLFEEKSSSNKTIAFFIAVGLLIGMLVVNHFDLNTGYLSGEENNDFWERLSLWKAALQANPDFLFGVGTGDYKIVLNEYFVSHGLHQYAKASYNSHNQFIQALFSNGFLGLISVFILIGRPIYLSVKHQNILGILVFFPFLIYGITEVYLGRYQGVVFFAFLHQCFVSYYNTKSSYSVEI